MSADAATLAAYAAHGAEYAERFRADSADARLAGFMELLPPGGAVLDLGCGPGRESALMRAAGLRPDPVDASPEMVALAQRLHGLPARVGTFDGIKAEAAYDGVWASFSLLHARRVDLPEIFAALCRALRPDGFLYVAMKTGEGEGRDKLGRFYTYVTVAELRALMQAAGFTILSVEEGEGAGLSGEISSFAAIVARWAEAPA